MRLSLSLMREMRWVFIFTHIQIQYGQNRKILYIY